MPYADKREINRILQVNRTVSVRVEGEKDSHRSRIVEVTDKYVALHHPLSQGQLVSIYRGDVVEVFQADDRGNYRFTAPVVQRIRDPLPLLVIPRPDMVEKTQRRGTYRMEAVLTVDVTRAPQEGEEQGQAFQALTADISGGGIRLITREALSKGEVLQLAIHFPDVVMELVGEVSTPPLRTSEEGRWAYGVRFLNITERVEDRIVAYIFSRQREMRRKGLA